MISKALAFIRSILSVSVPDSYQEEFDESLRKFNFTRAKIISFVFIVMEFMVVAFSCIEKRYNAFIGMSLKHMYMYFVIIAVMIVFFVIFIIMQKNITLYRKGIDIIGTLFTAFILCWCAGISLLDQAGSNEQAIVYDIAVLAVAMTPLFRPATSLLMYFFVHAGFLVLLPYFASTGRLPFGITINSTTLVMVAWALSVMRFKSQVSQFVDKKVIQEKNERLSQMNVELAIANKKLEKLSKTDSLTGINNRLVFDRTIAVEWDRCKRQFAPLSFIMIDIDFFKAFNDSYGHQAGDDCLRRVAEVLTACVKRSSDTVARYGGEEFGVILPYMEKEDAFKFAELIRQKVEGLAIEHGSSSVSDYVTISIGINTIVPTSDASINDFINIADRALYDAKKLRNVTVVA